MGYALAYSPCFGCGTVFGYNPHKVPSMCRVPGDPKTREPICAACIQVANTERARVGIPALVPHPDAYEPIPEHDL